MLGILSADAGFAGGSFSLTTEGVREAFETIATQMGCSVEDAAFDCWRVVNANLSQAVRRPVAGQGHQPQHMLMLAYCGIGPVFAVWHASDLGLHTVQAPH